MSKLYSDNHDAILNHMKACGSLSIRDALADYGLTGGHITKIMSDLRRRQEPIVKVWAKNAYTGKRYAVYNYVKASQAA